MPSDDDVQGYIDGRLDREAHAASGMTAALSFAVIGDARNPECEETANAVVSFLATSLDSS